MSCPSTRPPPAAGCSSPSSVLISVLLPAPLGPSSPTAPPSTATDTLSSAVRAPYFTVSPLSSMMGPPAAGVMAALFRSGPRSFHDSRAAAAPAAQRPQARQAPEALEAHEHPLVDQPRVRRQHARPERVGAEVAR